VLDKFSNISLERVFENVKNDDAIANLVNKIGPGDYEDAIWFHTEEGFDKYINDEKIEMSKLKVLDLHFVATMTTRSWREGVIMIYKGKKKNQIIIKSTHPEGHSPQEAFVLIKALRQLQVRKLSVFLLGQDIQENRTGIHKVRTYMNKRFCKMTVREDFLSAMEQELQTIDEGVAIFGFEGFMLPSKLEVEMARKGGFDFYVITNISFMDIAQRLNFVPNLYVISQKSLGDIGEIPQIEQVQGLIDSA